MITFYPGPSKIYSEIAGFMQDAFDSGILQLNHRSRPFMAMLETTIQLLHQRLNIPQEYAICFTSSATECWEIIAQSLVKNKVNHIYNGAFGQKWFEYSAKIKSASGTEFGLQETIFQANIDTDADLICITQNETSNGTQVSMESLVEIKNRLNTDTIIAIDATSSMAGQVFNWHLADVWFASVQKCFGLPAGMGIMVYSPKALERAKEINDRKFYNSLLFIHENFQQFQTHYTPNVLGIYLLKRVLEFIPNINETAAKLSNRATEMYAFLARNNYNLLIENEAVRSETVMVISMQSADNEKLKINASQNGIVLGSGYGKLKETTFRIANFPAISDADFDQLKAFITSYKP